ncbi:MAG TPA: type IV secretion system DNA-binding domain-containing protein, partial [Clostridia bacterium]|nr:type IV secretion system DNA-binding domain-containing protein [Clostridia bacterium]
MLVTGTTGSGKSRGILRPVIEQALAQGDAAVVIDVKGDLLPIVREALLRCGRERDLAVLGIGPTDYTFNPLATPLQPAQLANQLVRASSIVGPAAADRLAGDDLYWAMARTELLTCLVELAQNLSLAGRMEAPVSLRHLQTLRGQLTQSPSRFEAWSKESVEFLSEAGACALKEYASLPETTKACVLTSATNLLAAFSRRPLNLLVQPTAKRPALNLHDIIDRSMVLVVTAGQAEHAADLLPGFLLFKSALYRMILCRPRLRVRQDNRILVVLDEYNRLISGHDSDGSEHVTMEAARSSRASFILACQNLSGLEALAGPTLVDKISALCGSLVFLSNSCSVTGRLAERCLG